MRAGAAHPPARVIRNIISGAGQLRCARWDISRGTPCTVTGRCYNSAERRLHMDVFNMVMDWLLTILQLIFSFL